MNNLFVFNEGSIKIYRNKLSSAKIWLGVILTDAMMDSATMKSSLPQLAILLGNMGGIQSVLSRLVIIWWRKEKLGTWRMLRVP